MTIFKGADSGRQRLSWGVEIAAGLVNAFPNTLGYLDELRNLSKEVCGRPDGGCISSKYDTESLFVWGHIYHLVPYANELTSAVDEEWKTAIRRNSIKSINGPRIVIHTDKRTTINDDIWRKINEYGYKRTARINLASKAMGKADILILPVESKRVVGLSVKVGTGTSEVKLSQQSASHTYKFKPNPYNLIGGMQMQSLQDINEVLTQIPDSIITQNNTCLRKDQFNKLGRRDRAFAVLKKIEYESWIKRVQQTVEESYSRLEEFGKALTKSEEFARFNVRELIIMRLIGDSPLQENCEMWLSGIKEPVNLSLVLSDESKFNAIEKIYTEMRPSSRGRKKSLVVYATAKYDREYVVCKIEPGFDGGRPNISQTKGIIYYFQEGRQLGYPTIWDLIQSL